MRKRGMLALGVILIAGGLAFGAASFLAPNESQLVYGTVRTATTHVTHTIQEQVFGQPPTISLGGSGDQATLDACTDSFTEMVEYSGANIPPIWAAHNYCKGDELLPWEVGQRFHVEGSDTVYEVVDIAHTPQTGARVSDIAGLNGTFALQTCFYGDEEMKFVGARPITDTPQ